MKFESATVDCNASFAYFIYPFLFEAGEFEQRVRAFESAREQVGSRQLPVWELQQFPEDDLLSQVAKYLNPRDRALATARLWKLNNALENVYGLGNRADWSLLWPPDGCLSFELGKLGKGELSFELVLFRVGVGFLTVRFQPKSSNVNDWLDGLHYFRFIRGQRGVQLKAQCRTGFDSERQQPIESPFFPEPARSDLVLEEDRGELDAIVRALLKTGANPSQPEQWWREVFVPGQLLPFAALFVDALPEGEIPHLLYKLRNFFHGTQGEHPTSEDLQLDNPALLPYVEQQWFAISLEGCAFLAVDAPPTPFFRQTLPEHLQQQYFLLFQLALHQRFALMMLSEQVAEQWLFYPLPRSRGQRSRSLSPLRARFATWLTGENLVRNNQREQIFEEIRDRLLAFTARGYFAQVMQREHHHRCYLKWQEAFQVERLYQEVSDEVREMHEYALMQQTRRVEDRLNLLGFLILIPGFFLSFLGINLRGITSGDEGIALGLAGAIVLVGLGLSLLILRLFRQPS